MANENNKLTFVRCPSCKSLVPALSTKCRMCNASLNTGDDQEEAQEEYPRQSRVRQKTMTISETEKEKIVNELIGDHQEPQEEVEVNPFFEDDSAEVENYEEPANFNEEDPLSSMIEEKEIDDDIFDVSETKEEAPFMEKVEDINDEPQNDREIEFDDDELDDLFSLDDENNKEDLYEDDDKFLEDMNDEIDSENINLEKEINDNDDMIKDIEDEKEDTSFDDLFSDDDFLNYLSEQEPKKAQKPEEEPKEVVNLKEEVKEEVKKENEVKAEIKEEKPQDNQKEIIMAEKNKQKEEKVVNKAKEVKKENTKKKEPFKIAGGASNFKLGQKDNKKEAPKKQESASKKESAPVVNQKPKADKNISNNNKTNEAKQKQEVVKENKQVEKKVEERKEEIKKEEVKKEKVALIQGSLVGWLVSFKEAKGEAFELRTGKFFVTNSSLKQGDFIIDDSSISTPHAMMSISSNGEIVVQDLMSEKGVFVKESKNANYEKKEASFKLKNGDFLKFGNIEYIVSVVPHLGE